jgi:hypothetical protein
MAFQYSTAVRNATLDAIESTTGTSARLYLYTGTVPATCATAASGTLLNSLTYSLPSDWLAAASGGTKSINGLWSIAGSVAGTAGYFRILDSTGTTVHIQGTVTATGGGGDMTLDSVSIGLNQVCTITAFTLTAGGA